MVILAIMTAICFLIGAGIYLYYTCKSRTRIHLDDEVNIIREKEKKEKIYAKENNRLKKFSRNPKIRIRQMYIKKIRKVMGKNTAIQENWTPLEIESAAGITTDCLMNNEFHVLYERARYSGDICNMKEVEQMKKAINDLQKGGK